MQLRKALTRITFKRNIEMNRLEQLIKLKAPAMSKELKVASNGTGFKVSFYGTNIFSNSGLTKNKYEHLEDLERAIGWNVKVFTEVADEVVFAFADFMHLRNKEIQAKLIEFRKQRGVE